MFAKKNIYRSVPILLCSLILFMALSRLLPIAQAHSEPLEIISSANNTPPPQYYSPMTFDSKRNRIVLFSAGAETWEYDGASWKRILTNNSPSESSLDNMIYDIHREVIVLYEGRNRNTWEYDGIDWTQISTQNTPPSRNHVSLAYDGNRQVVILSSGRTGTYCNFGGTNYTDVWEYNGVDWVERINSGGPLNEIPSVAYDPVHNQTIHFAGRHNCNLRNETWTYDGVDITQLFPSVSPPPTSGPIVFDENLNKIILFGGCQASNSSGCLDHSNDIWTFDGKTWNLLDIINKPPGRYLHSVTYDTNRDRLVVFGGCTDFHWGGDCRESVNDLWEFDGAEWTEIIVSGKPKIYLPLILSTP